MDIVDIENVFDKLGFYKYEDCCGCIHFQNEPFSKKDIKIIDEEAKGVLEFFVQKFAQEIDKQILEDISNGYSR